MVQTAKFKTEAIDLSDGLESFVLGELQAVAQNAGRKLLKMRNVPSERVINSALRIQSRWPEDWMLLYGILRAEGLTAFQITGALRDLKLDSSRLESALGPDWLAYMLVFALAGMTFPDGNEPLQELRGTEWSSAVEDAASVAVAKGVMVDLGDPTMAEHRDWCATRGAAWSVALYGELKPSTRQTLMTPWATLVRPEFIRQFWHNTESSSATSAAYSVLMASVGGRKLLSIEWEDSFSEEHRKKLLSE